MSKSIKLKNNTYWDSSSISHGRKKLNDVIKGNNCFDIVVGDRTIDGIKYVGKLGIGAGKTIAIELSNSDTIVARLDVCSDGTIYNYVTGNKLAEKNVKRYNLDTYTNKSYATPHGVGGGNSNELSIVNGNLCVVNITFDTVVDIPANSYINILTFPNEMVPPQGNVVFSAYSISNGVNQGFAYLQKGTKYLRVKFAEAVSKGAEIDINGVYSI